ncbi:MAG: permease-like cell division protein FtsX [Propionibacteriaceae bacterium]|nr:permease-like cell division protein FtsX [Propionibacteriaceae bacterium]
MRHTFREAWTGIRRNAAMTVAVVVTMAVSLTLFGVGLLTAMQVDLIKGRWYDKIEISVFLCVADSPGGTCTPGKATTDAQRETIRTALEANPEVAQVFYESQEEAFADFQEMFKNQPTMRDSLTLQQMPDSFRIKLKNPENYQGVVSEAKGLQGVWQVQDLHTILDNMFKILNFLKWVTIGMSVALLIAASLQIANTIRMAAFTRRRELGIMRLVGASNTYILLPFLLESLFAAFLGIAVAGVLLVAGLWLLVLKNLQVSLKALPWVDLVHVWTAIGWVALVGAILAIIPTLLATRKYLRV